MMNLNYNTFKTINTIGKFYFELSEKLLTMTVRLLDIISFITTFQLLLLAFVIINYQKGKRISNKILAAFMLANAILVGNFVLFRMRILTFLDLPYLYFIGSASYLLLGPLLYVYTKSLCYQDFNLKKVELLHFLPYVVVSVFLIIHYYIRTTGIVGDSTGQVRSLTLLDRIIQNGTLHLQILIYMILTFGTIQVYRKELKELFSSIEHINLSWLLLLLIGFILMWLMDVVNFALSFVDVSFRAVRNVLLFFSLTINFSFATVIVYRGLKYPELFSGIEEKPKYAKSKLTKAESERYIKTLTSYMKTERPYLEPSLSLNELADKLSISPRYLSQTINDLLNQNFFDLINSYRIEEAKRLFSNPSNKRKTILEILYEVGFNSKSVFNSAFKKHTGITPTEFRKLNQT